MLWVDLLILATLAAYGFFGWRRGFIVELAELVLFVGSFAASIFAYPLLHPAAKAISPKGDEIVAVLLVLLLWFGLEALLALGWRRLRGKVPKSWHGHLPSRLGGVGTALLKAVVLIEVVLLIVASAPLPTGAKDSILKSNLASPFVEAGSGLQAKFDDVFGRALRQTLSLKTVRTGEEGSVSLGFTKPDADICPQDEDRMLELLNDERTSRGLPPLEADDKLRGVARAHSRDMLARGYFSHVTPDGVDPFQRMAKAGITYQYAGENLAFAPTVDIAHDGLMKSPGHRANILKPQYTKVGIGCADAGIHGKMFSQEFNG